MKKNFILAATALLFSSLLYLSCSKSDQKSDVGKPPLAEEAKRWWDQTPHADLPVNWQHAYQSGDGTAEQPVLMVPIRWDIQLVGSSGWSHKELLVYRSSAGTFSAKIQEVIATNITSESGKKFTGYVRYFDPGNKLLSAGSFENGQLKEKIKVEQFASVEAFKKSPRTEGCSTYQTGYFDEQHVFNVVLTTVCTVDGPFLPGGDPNAPQEPKTDRDPPGDGGGGFGNAGGEDVETAIQKGYICGTYRFKTVGDSYTGTMTDVGVMFVHRVQGSFNFEFGDFCVVFPNYNLSENDASKAWIEAWNSAVKKTTAQLNNSTLPLPGVMQQMFINNLKKTIKDSNPGASFSRTRCSTDGTIPETKMNYNCN